MSNPTHKDFACLINILDSIDKIRKYTKSYSNADELYEDSRSFDAVMMNFIVIVEMVEKLTDDFKYSTDDKIDWFKIRGFRNMIAHNYFGIDAEEVWQIVQAGLFNLESRIKDIIEK